LFASTVIPCAFEKLPRSNQAAFADGSICRLVELGFSPDRLAVYVDPRITARLEAGSERLARAVHEQAVVENTEDRADVVISQEPEDGQRQGIFLSDLRRRTRCCLAEVDAARGEGLLSLLSAAIRHVSRIHRLLEVAGTSGAPRGREPIARLQLKLFLLGDGEGPAPRALDWGRAPVVLQVGQQVEYELKNTGSEGACLTLLAINESTAIEQLFPKMGTAQQRPVPPGEARRGRIVVTREGLGNELLVGIATVPTAGCPDFGFLQQGGFPDLGRGATGTSENDTTSMGGDPLTDLLRSARQREGARGVGVIEAGEYNIQLVAVRTTSAGP
jgi:hypothetical protein